MSCNCAGAHALTTYGEGIHCEKSPCNANAAEALNQVTRRSPTGVLYQRIRTLCRQPDCNAGTMWFTLHAVLATINGCFLRFAGILSRPPASRKHYGDVTPQSAASRFMHIILGARWTPMKILYFINRYFGLFVVVAQAVLEIMNTRPSWFSLLSLIVVVEDRIVMVTVTVLYVAQFMTILVVGIVLNKGANRGIPRWYQSLCGTVQLSRRSVGHLESDTTSYLTPANGVPLTWGWGGHMIAILTRDSLIYYTCIFAVYLLNILVLAIASPEYWAVADSWGIVVPTAATTHLVLNLSRASAREKAFIHTGSHYRESNTGRLTGSELMFAGRSMYELDERGSG
ncbi:hypothetical protein OE88DRAFT_1646010 [Heliocybe sulcata]|uniref:Uncharacterized protein n=1 Tax=Heliocybe sulcata TaxID=5364 RepID=A0A5C3MXG4_9AGAM|nr:hypothetical protein OE88DRAFT_1646010 [Heliocybe sulcata]